MSTKKKIKTGIITALVLALVIVMINVMQIPEVIRCERLTAKYGHEFEVFLQDENGWKLKSMKVLNYGNLVANVYCVWCTPGDYLIGTVNVYKCKSDEGWRLANEQVVWSDEGTLDGVVMPYWWHNIPS